jgi:hypothetical protein
MTRADAPAPESASALGSPARRCRTASVAAAPRFRRSAAAESVRRVAHGAITDRVRLVRPPRRYRVLELGRLLARVALLNPSLSTDAALPAHCDTVPLALTRT